MGKYDAETFYFNVFIGLFLAHHLCAKGWGEDSIKIHRIIKKTVKNHIDTGWFLKKYVHLVFENF